MTSPHSGHRAGAGRKATPGYECGIGTCGGKVELGERKGVKEKEEQEEQGKFMGEVTERSERSGDGEVASDLIFAGFACIVFVVAGLVVVFLE